MLIVGLTMLFLKKRWWHVIDELCKPQGQTLNYVLGLIALPIGLLLVMLNNVWDAGLLALVVTLFGWVVLLKSILMFVSSPAQLGRLIKTFKMEDWWYLYVVIVLIIGAYLAYAGFMA